MPGLLRPFFVLMSAHKVVSITYIAKYSCARTQEIMSMDEGLGLGGTIDMIDSLLHIIQNSMQPLHGLCHSEIIFQKVVSHINGDLCS